MIPAKRVGRRLSSITREGFDLNSAMNTQMTERFNVSGALLVKLFGQGRRESKAFGDRAGRVRDIGIKSAMYSRTFMIALALVGSIGTVLVYWLGGQLVISGAITLGTMMAMAALVVRLYDPLTALSNARVDIMTALVSFDRVFEVLDLDNPLTDRPGAVDLVDPKGRIELDHVTFRYSSGAEVSLRSLEVGSSGAVDDGPGSEVLHDVSATIEAGQLVALVGPSGAGKTTLSSLIPRLYDVTEGVAAHRRPRRARPHPRLAAGRHRRRVAGPAPVPRLGRREPPLRPPRGLERRAGRGLPGRPDPRRDHGACPTATTPSSASAATGCRAASASAWPSPACSSRTRPSSCSTRPPATSTPRTSPWCSRRWPRRSPAAPPWSSPTACRPSSAPTRSWCSTTAASSSGAATTSCWRADGLYAELYRTLVRGDIGDLEATWADLPDLGRPTGPTA